MNENLNLVEILKNVPKGTKLYSTVYGEVELIGIYSTCSIDYSIRVKTKHGSYASIPCYGRVYIYPEYERILFPAKDQRDWSKFKVAPEKVEVVLRPFDRVLGRSDGRSWDIDLYSHYEEDDEYPYFCLYSAHKEIIPYNDETAHLINTTDPCPIDYEIKFSKEHK